MAAARSSGVCEILPQWVGPELRGSWRWFVDVGGAPTFNQCQELAILFSEWDRGPFGGGIIGYRAFRSQLTTLDHVVVRSVDPAGPRVSAFLNTGLGHDGLLADIGIGSRLAPVVHWRTLPGSNRDKGRTYLVGVGQGVMSLADPNVVDSFAASEIAALFTLWPQFLVNNGFGAPVLLSFQRHGVEYADMPISLINEAYVYPRLLSGQRRREVVPSPIG